MSENESASGRGRSGRVPLPDAPRNAPLRVVELAGGEGVRRRLLAMGFHKGDLVELDAEAIFRGPLLVRNLTSDSKVALGRSVAQKVLVEAA